MAADEQKLKNEGLLIPDGLQVPVGEIAHVLRNALLPAAITLQRDKPDLDRVKIGINRVLTWVDELVKAEHALLAQAAREAAAEEEE